MHRGPRGEKRPADVIGNAVKVMRIATGEETEELDRATSAAAELGSRGGKARAAKLSPQQRRTIAKKGATARWKNKAKSLTQKPTPPIINSHGPLSNPTTAVRPCSREPLFMPHSCRSGIGWAGSNGWKLGELEIDGEARGRTCKAGYAHNATAQGSILPPVPSCVAAPVLRP